MNQEYRRNTGREGAQGGGFVPWLLAKMQRKSPKPSRIEVLERIALTPRNSLILVEVETKKFLIATSAEGNLSIKSLSNAGIPLEPWPSVLPEMRQFASRSEEADPC